MSVARVTVMPCWGFDAYELSPALLIKEKSVLRLPLGTFGRLPSAPLAALVLSEEPDDPR